MVSQRFAYRYGTGVGTVADETVSYGYTYDNQEKLTHTYISGAQRIDAYYGYDSLDRLNSRYYYVDDTDYGLMINESFEYVEGNSDQLGFISAHSIGIYDVNQEYAGSTNYEFFYDSLGNLFAIMKNGSTAVTYQYDNQNQLTREDNYERGETYVYTYDDAGNITEKRAYMRTGTNS